MTTSPPPAPLTKSGLEIVLEERLSDARTLRADAYLSQDILITNKLDFGACESVYQGTLTDGYRPGPFDEREDGVRAFQAQLATAYLTGRWEKPPQISLGASHVV